MLRGSNAVVDGETGGDSYGEDFGGGGEEIEFGLKDGSDGVADFGGVAGEEVGGEVELIWEEEEEEGKGERVSFDFSLREFGFFLPA